MRILFDGRVCCDHFTGIGRYAFGLIRHLPAAFPDLRFVVAWNPSLPNGRFDWDPVRRFGNVSLVSCPGSGKGLLDPWSLRSAARAEHVDVVQAPYFVGALASPVPTVVTIHDDIPFVPEGRRGIGAWIARRGARRAARSAAAVVTPTEAVRARIIDRFGLDAARVFAIPEGVAPLPRGELHDPSLAATPYVLSVGVHKPHKNLEGLLDAMAEAFPSGKEKLVLAGPCSAFTPSLRARAKALGLEDRVLFMGSVDDARLAGLYRSATALALVSFDEGFGLPLAEGMSMRVPIIASDLPVLREVCGSAAIYVDPRSPRSIADGLRNVFMRKNGAEERLAEGERRVAALDWSALAPRYGVCYRRAAS